MIQTQLLELTDTWNHSDGEGGNRGHSWAGRLGSQKLKSLHVY